MNKRALYVYDVVMPSELAAGLHGYTETVTVILDSGDPGGTPGEFQLSLQQFLGEWFDGATVTDRTEREPNAGTERG
jgi:hypothetical protein